MNRTEALNFLISEMEGVEKGQISDGYHTFDELYEHRITLFVVLCAWIHGPDTTPIWKSTVHSDGSVWDGWFILGIGEEEGKQITYHLPMRWWSRCKFARTYSHAPPYDGHTSEDVLKRLMEL